MHPEADRGKVQLVDRTVQGTHKINFACRVPEELGGITIQRNEPQHNRPLHVPLTVINQGNASDAEQWFGDGAYLLWKITGNPRYWNAWQCTIEMCKVYTEQVDLNERFFRQSKVTSHPLSEGTVYDWTWPSQQPITYARDEDGYVTVSAAAGVQVSMEQQDIWFRLKSDSIIRVTVGGEDANGKPLVPQVAITISPKKDWADESVQKLFTLPIQELTTEVQTYDVPVSHIFIESDEEHEYIFARPGIITSWGNVKEYVEWADDLLNGREGYVGSFDIPDTSAGGIIGF